MTRAGGALTWLVVAALAFAPAVAAPRHDAAPIRGDGPSALDLSARWPVLLDASTRVVAAGAGERALPRAQRSRPQPRLRALRRDGRRRTPSRPTRSLVMLGRRQDDGG